MSDWYKAQIDNRNYLSPIGFVFLLEKAPKVSYLCQRTSIPTFSVGTIDIPTAGFVRVPIEGNAVYSDLEMEFLVDENLENYMQIHNWMRALGTPTDYIDKQLWSIEKSKAREDNPFTSNGTLQVLNNNNLHNFDVTFVDMFPSDLSTLQFDVTMADNEQLRATVTFKYSYYEIRKPNKIQKL